jgi:hypothetical protein
MVASESVSFEDFLRLTGHPEAAARVAAWPASKHPSCNQEMDAEEWYRMYPEDRPKAKP